MKILDELTGESTSRFAASEPRAVRFLAANRLVGGPRSVVWLEDRPRRAVLRDETCPFEGPA
jgi:hypothetical protein